MIKIPILVREDLYFETASCFHYWDWNALVCGLHFKAGLIKLPLKLGQRQVITFHKNLWDTISHQCPTLTLTVLLSLRSRGFRWLFPTQNPTLSDLYMNFHYGEGTILSTLPSIEIYHWYGQFRYNLISFLANNQNRHPMALPWGESFVSLKYDLLSNFLCVLLHAVSCYN